MPAFLLKEAFKWNCLKLGKVELQSTYLNTNIARVFSFLRLSYTRIGRVFPNWVVVSDVSQISGEPKAWRAGASTWLCPTEGGKPWSMLAWRKRYALSPLGAPAILLFRRIPHSEPEILRSGLVLPVWKWHLKFVRWLHEVILICCAGCVRHAREVPVSVRKDEFLHSNAYLNVNRSLHIYPQWYCFPDCLPGNSDACENDPFPEWKTVLDPLRQERPGRLPPSADSKTLDNKQVKRLPRIKGVSASPVQYSRAWFKLGFLSYSSVTLIGRCPTSLGPSVSYLVGHKSRLESGPWLLDWTGYVHPCWWQHQTVHLTVVFTDLRAHLLNYYLV